VIFPEVLGNERARTVLARVLASGRIPHALLFHGPEGVGKGLVARLFARALVCTEPGPDGTGCGCCVACRKVSHGNHPDVLLVTRLSKKERRADTGAADAEDGGDDRDDDSRQIQGGDLRPFIIVQQIRELNHHAAYAPREGRRRVFLVEPADRMHAESQNALLKTLEEPPGAAVVVLVASRPHVLLPTVRSRCLALGFGAMHPDDLARALETRGVSSQEASARAALAEGRPGRAMALDLPAMTKRRDMILVSLEALASSPRAAADLNDYAERIVGESEADLLEGLDLVQSLLRDAARVASGSAALLNADLAPRVGALGRLLGAHRATDIVTLTDRLRGDLRLNLNKTLVAETLLASVAGGPIPSFA
jgi:DNA polymerase-3 subunit delta'